LPQTGEATEIFAADPGSSQEQAQAHAPKTAALTPKIEEPHSLKGAHPFQMFASLIRLDGLFEAEQALPR
jgi:hypothetical protein